MTLTQKEKQEFVLSLSDKQLLAFAYDWEVWGRTNQQQPGTDWHIWLILSGRGWG